MSGGVGPGRLGRQARELAALAGQSAWQALQGFYHSDNPTYAASIAYYSLLSLFPFSLLALTVLGGVTGDVDARNAVLRFVLQYFPQQFEFITAQLDVFRTNTVTFGIFGTIALVWGALGIFGAISTAVNYAWGVEKNRSYWRHKLFSFLMLSFAALLLLAALLVRSAAGVVGSAWFAAVSGAFPWLLVLRGLTIRSATTMVFVCVVGLVYYFAPNTKVRFRDVWVGAVVTGLLWKGALETLSWYIRDMTRFVDVNGSIATVVIFLIWVYVQAAILLYGAEFTVAYARLRKSRRASSLGL